MHNGFQGRRVIVTGGLGFVGSHLARRLVQAGAQVTIIDALLPHCGGSLEHIVDFHPRVRLATFDLCHATQHGHLFQDVELLFSLAGATSHVRSMRDPLADMKSNVQAHISLLEVLRQVAPEAHVIVGSTRQVYGRARRLPVDEHHPLHPVDINGIHQRTAEEYYRLYHECYDLRSACLRLTNTYGPGMNLRNNCHGVASVFLGRALRGEPLDLFGGGHQRRDFNHIDDVVEALLAATHLTMEDHEVYNLGAERDHSLREFAEVLEQFLPTTIRDVPFPEGSQQIDVGDYHADFAKFSAATDWYPQINLWTGLASTVEHYRRHPEQYPCPAAPLEATESNSGPPSQPSLWLQTQR